MEASESFGSVSFSTKGVGLVIIIWVWGTKVVIGSSDFSESESDEDAADDEEAVTILGTGGLAGGPPVLGAGGFGGGADDGAGGLCGGPEDGGGILGGSKDGGGGAKAGGDPHTETSGDQSDPSAALSSTTILGKRPVLPLHSPIHQPSSTPLGFLE